MTSNIEKAKKEMLEWLRDQYLPHDGYSLHRTCYTTKQLLNFQFKNQYPQEWVNRSIRELNRISELWYKKIESDDNSTSVYGSESESLQPRPINVTLPRSNIHVASQSKVSKSFLAIDFETANHNRNSACAIGLVKVANNKITRFESYLIKPPTNYFVFTYLHGISYNQVKNYPTFDEIWFDIRHHFKGIDFVVAHNASFDKAVLEACCNYYGIKKPEVNFECTMKLSRRIWNIRPTKLSNVCNHFSIPLNHHQAASDTLACAKIMLLAINNKSLFDVNSIYVPRLVTNKPRQYVKNIEHSDTMGDRSHQSTRTDSFRGSESRISEQIPNNNTYENKVSQKYDQGEKHLFLKIVGIIVGLYLLTQLFKCDRNKKVSLDHFEVEDIFLSHLNNVEINYSIVFNYEEQLREVN